VQLDLSASVGGCLRGTARIGPNTEGNPAIRHSVSQPGRSFRARLTAGRPDINNFYIDLYKIKVIVKVNLKDLHPWIERLDDEDKAFLKRFALASGSLKAVAAEYGISYPTVRLRLDRLIEKIRIYDDREIHSDFERALRARYAEGKIDMSTLKELLAAHHRELGR